MRPINSELQMPSTSASRNRGSSKTLSQRLLTSAGLEPHPITKSVWKWTNRATLLTILLCFAYLFFGKYVPSDVLGVRIPLVGRNTSLAFQTRHVSRPHQVFANDCGRCHTTWAPAERLVATFTGKRVWSVSNEKCEACHVGALHHENQWPRHDPLADDPRGVFLSCAKCHREHRGDVNVAEAANAHCVECHVDLEDHAFPGLTDPAWAQSVTSFDGTGGHPEFALVRRLEGDSDVPKDSVVEFFERSRQLDALVLPAGESMPEGKRWQDPGRVRFNHFAHLSRPMPVEGNDENAARWGEDRIDGVTQSVQLRCADCHQPDDAGRYMLRIDYDNHCRICHPIRFDIEEPFQNVLVPHAGISATARKESPEAGIEVLLGFLTEQYAELKVGERPEGEADPLVGLPGRPARSILTATERDDVRRSVDEARDYLLRELDPAQIRQLQGVNSVIGESARGGCRFCHQVTNLTEEPYLRIASTRIPERWMPHSRFDHSRHRELTCVACHQDFTAEGGPRSVERSFDTGDVLMPGIDVCRHCHTPKPSRSDVGSARSDCVECHRYHDHSLDPLDMGYNLLLEPIEDLEDRPQDR